MQPLNQNQLQEKVDARLRTLRTLWFALLVSIGFYFVLTIFTGNPPNPNNALSIGLAAAGLLLVIISLPIKQKYLKQAVDEQRIELVQTGYIVACALCEVAAMFGLLDHFLTGNRYYFVPFIVAVGGDLLHFPQRQHVVDACYKSQTF